MFRKVLFLAVFVAFIAIFLNHIINYLFNYNHKIKLFSVEELKKYNGIDRPDLYLAVVGNIYNVSGKSQFYGPGQTYNFFVGHDASRSFVTGKFTAQDVSDEVADFDKEQLRSLNHWIKFYKKEYPLIGKLIGKYYDQNGKLTEYGKNLKRLIKKAEKVDEDDQLEKMKFPPCNIEWDPTNGSKVWCTKRSGGIERNWAGVPRQLYTAGSGSYRCACVEDHSTNLPNVKEYEGCEPTSPSCWVQN